MRRQEPTNPDTALTPQQEAAADLLATGKTVTDTAEAIGVTRQTVSEWLHYNPEFQAALQPPAARTLDGTERPTAGGASQGAGRVGAGNRGKRLAGGAGNHQGGGTGNRGPGRFDRPQGNPAD